MNKQYSGGVLHSREWLFFARSDIKAGKASFKEGIYHDTCFHTHQAVEKALKAVLVTEDKETFRTHDLVYLLGQLNGKADFEQFEKSLNYLNQFYIATRYPDALPGSLPNGLPTEEDAKQSLEYAEEIVEFVEDRVNVSLDS